MIATNGVGVSGCTVGVASGVGVSVAFAMVGSTDLTVGRIWAGAGVDVVVGCGCVTVGESVATVGRRSLVIGAES